MAEVFLAKSVSANGLSKFVAIKRILPQFAQKHEFTEMFKEEAKIAINLNHGNIVSINDFKVEKDQLYIIMDFVQGHNLRQLLQQKKKSKLKLSIPFIIYIIKEVAAGLDYAHRSTDKSSGLPLNMIHRDMSPQNIMISYDGEVKVIDFGIAKAESGGEQTKVGTLKGKFSYMSPEQAEGIPNLDQTSDIFSLGIILWELLADDRLFIGHNEIAILKKIKDCEIPELKRINPNIPTELEKIVKKALTKDRQQRYQNAHEMHRDLNRFLNIEYPDFTPLEFASFIKYLFEKEYQEAQEKLIEYAKIIPNEVTAEKPQQRGSLEVVPESSEPDTELRVDLSQPSQKVELSNFSQASIKISPLEQSSSYNTGVGTKTTPPDTQTRSKNTAQPPYYPNKKQQPLSIGLMFTFLLALSGATLAWYYYPQLKNLKSNAPVATEKNKVKISEEDFAQTQTSVENLNGEGATTEASGPLFLHVQSQPARAKIFINGEDSGLLTPQKISVKANSPVQITLVADGYIPFERRVLVTKSGASLKATLLSVPTGFLDIKVPPGSLNSVVYINGLRLQEQPPILKYAVPAGVSIQIRVVDTYTSGEAEASVKVNAEERKAVYLIPKIAQKESL